MIKASMIMIGNLQRDCAARDDRASRRRKIRGKVVKLPQVMTAAAGRARGWRTRVHPSSEGVTVRTVYSR